ncbi:grasp-with-spasm system ATP-grasp peptide maturase [Chryseobacterium panacisoli]|uniref:Grasp-with-spasm system ATP-grasp peptide maturase n=1 Tax=Chryseobacterium panacisoli TaxID=1807141 RepID=A0A5D8ZKB6_9FLAO|nr:grasp-with-spasm system ATP-grasp peptide maturase [Chryseobacterium panacisoli]TZF93174.1 grasp-with-spasm system ATP-grasp peptide maturase [Chryseobacterium panacisoli]
MILILSTSWDDDTNVVIEHLNNMGEPYIRLNDIDLFNGKTQMSYAVNSHGQLIIQNEFFGKIDVSEVTTVWYRKWGNFDKYKEMFEEDLSLDMLQYLYSEYSGVLNVILFALRNKKWVNHYTAVMGLSKIATLTKAETAGLKIPFTIVTNQFESDNRLWITKSLNEGKVIHYKNKNFPVMTFEYNNPTESFFPSLFQERVIKEYELRVFHLKGKNYSMAIFSQNDPATSVDFRNYNQEKPNRFIRYQMPRDLDRKVTKLMKALNLQTGSIDIIKGIDGEYYFLEVNPFGQFRMTSYRCNYNLHYEMALLLKKMNHEKNSSSGS